MGGRGRGRGGGDMSQTPTPGLQSPGASKHNRAVQARRPSSPPLRSSGWLKPRADGEGTEVSPVARRGQAGRQAEASVRTAAVGRTGPFTARPRWFRLPLCSFPCRPTPCRKAMTTISTHTLLCWYRIYGKEQTTHTLTCHDMCVSAFQVAGLQVLFERRADMRSICILEAEGSQLQAPTCKTF